MGAHRHLQKWVLAPTFESNKFVCIYGKDRMKSVTSTTWKKSCRHYCARLQIAVTNCRQDNQLNGIGNKLAHRGVATQSCTLQSGKDGRTNMDADMGKNLNSCPHF
jgi:hypothetical protein